MSKLNGKVVVVTGGNSGIGRATARALVAQGAKVVIFGRNAETLADAAAELGGAVTTVQGDVTRRADLERLFTEAAALGPVQALFVNAGVAFPAPLEASDESFFDRIFDVNVKGAYFTVQAALPHLAEGASIILNASAVAAKGMAGMSVYSASKAAVRSFARTLSAELLPRGIRVNTVSPGPIETPIFDRMGLPEAAVDEMAGQILSVVPAGRFGAPDDIARAVVFLADPSNTYLAGADLVVDGGYSQL
ncbi:MAG: SDR family oxidoreductase [Alphaproteobacteria bacterium]|nr:SDR family oxidoreductase [Alphaproteobacteria bacterium]